MTCFVKHEYCCYTALIFSRRFSLNTSTSCHLPDINLKIDFHMVNIDTDKVLHQGHQRVLNTAHVLIYYKCRTPPWIYTLAS